MTDPNPSRQREQSSRPRLGRRRGIINPDYVMRGGSSGGSCVDGIGSRRASLLSLTYPMMVLDRVMAGAAAAAMWTVSGVGWGA